MTTMSHIFSMSNIFSIANRFRISARRYTLLNPFEQGYVSYFQSHWRSAEVPSNNPYITPKGTPLQTKDRRWDDGYYTAREWE